MSDANGDMLTVTLTINGGTIGGLTDADPNTPGIQLVGSASVINQALLGATFTAEHDGTPGIRLSVTDGKSSPVVQDFTFAAMAANPNLPTYKMESQAPGIDKAGAPAVLGDGNADGIADNQQEAVSSGLFTLKNPPPGGAASSFVTLVAGGEQGKVDTANPNQTSVTSYLQVDVPAKLPALINMPLALISFAADMSHVGATDVFSMYVDDTLGINGYWTQLGNGFWVNLASPVFGGHVVQEGDKTRLDFQITDGGPFDADGLANGVVSIVGAPAHLPLSMLGYMPDLAAGGFWF